MCKWEIKKIFESGSSILCKKIALNAQEERWLFFYVKKIAVNAQEERE